MRRGAPGTHHVGVVDDFIEGVQASGRLTFSVEEISHAVPTTGRALEAALRRRAKAGAITRIASSSGFFVIVPPEHRTMGCPPVEWWLDDLMAHFGAPYYVGLLSAAAMHGSSHFAVMETQVVTSRWLRPIQVGRTRIRFLQRREVTDMPVEVRQGEWGPLNVATQETVLVDLVRYRVCGMDRTALVLAEMAKMHGKRLVEALDAADDVPTAQRVGYLVDWLGFERCAEAVRHWLEGRPLRPIPLQPGRDDDIPELNERWRVRGTVPEGALA